MVKKNGGGKLISLQNTIGVEKLCKDGYCISKGLRNSPKGYMAMLKHAIRDLNEYDFSGAFIFLIGTLESLEREENFRILHNPSYREQADRYYKILRECKGEQPEATKSTRIVKLKPTDTNGKGIT